MYSVDHHTFCTSDKSLPSIQSTFFWLRVPQGQYPRPELAPPERSPSGAGPRCALAVDESLRYRPPTTVSVSGARPPPPHAPPFSTAHPTPHPHDGQLNSAVEWGGWPPPSQLVRTLVPPLQSALQRFKTGAAPLKTFRL